MSAASISTQLGRVRELIRYHRASQFARRLVSVVKTRLLSRLPRQYRPRASTCQLKTPAIPVLQAMFQRRLGLWPSRACSQHLNAMTEGEFCFLNETRDLRCQQSGVPLGVNWRPDSNRLWRFHLQSQEHLTELAGAGHTTAAWNIIQSWLATPAHQTPFADADAWHPFCISRRLPVWLTLAATHPPDPSIAEQFWKSGPIFCPFSLSDLTRSVEHSTGHKE